VIQELIFTSAPRGLQLGKSGFCTVASTVGMAGNLAKQLESLSGYRHLAPAGSAENPAVFSFLTSKIGGELFYVLSRVADAGLDYSKRSNKFAHHLATTRSEELGSGPTDLFYSDGFYTEWDKDPQSLPPRRISTQPRLVTVCQQWGAVTGDPGWAGVAAEALKEGRQVYLIVNPQQPALELVDELLRLFPPSARWQYPFTTFAANLPPNVGCQLRCLMTGSPEIAIARRSPRNLVLDLTTALGVASGALVENARTGVVIDHFGNRPSSQKPNALDQDDFASDESDQSPSRRPEPVFSDEARSEDDIQVEPPVVKTSRIANYNRFDAPPLPPSSKRRREPAVKIEEQKSSSFWKFLVLSLVLPFIALLGFVGYQIYGYSTRIVENQEKKKAEETKKEEKVELMQEIKKFATEGKVQDVKNLLSNVEDESAVLEPLHDGFNAFLEQHFSEKDLRPSVDLLSSIAAEDNLKKQVYEKLLGTFEKLLMMSTPEVKEQIITILQESDNFASLDFELRKRLVSQYRDYSIAKINESGTVLSAIDFYSANIDNLESQQLKDDFKEVTTSLVEKAKSYLLRSPENWDSEGWKLDEFSKTMNAIDSNQIFRADREKMLDDFFNSQYAFVTKWFSGQTKPKQIRDYLERYKQLRETVPLGDKSRWTQVEVKIIDEATSRPTPQALNAITIAIELNLESQFAAKCEQIIASLESSIALNVKNKAFAKAADLVEYIDKEEFKGRARRKFLKSLEEVLAECRSNNDFENLKTSFLNSLSQDGQLKTAGRSLIEKALESFATPVAMGRWEFLNSEPKRNNNNTNIELVLDKNNSSAELSQKYEISSPESQVSFKQEGKNSFLVFGPASIEIGRVTIIENERAVFDLDKIPATERAIASQTIRALKCPFLFLKINGHLVGAIPMQKVGFERKSWNEVLNEKELSRVAKDYFVSSKSFSIFQDPGGYGAVMLNFRSNSQMPKLDLQLRWGAYQLVKRLEHDARESKDKLKSVFSEATRSPDESRKFNEKILGIEKAIDTLGKIEIASMKDIEFLKIQWESVKDQWESVIEKLKGIPLENMKLPEFGNLFNSLNRSALDDVLAKEYLSLIELKEANSKSVSGLIVIANDITKQSEYLGELNRLVCDFFEGNGLRPSESKNLSPNRDSLENGNGSTTKAEAAK
jgi:GTPase-associated protein 1, N-terminal domain type 2/GTPase-associated protein 1, middle domain